MVGGRAIVVVGAVALVVGACTSTPAEQAPGAQVSSRPSSSSAAPGRPVALALVPADKAADVAPGEPVTVSASDGKLTEVVVINQEGAPVAGQMAPDGLGWRSTEGLGYG